MSRTRRYLVNVLWNWASVLVLIVVGFVLSPFMVRQLGASDYGAWTLALSLVEYYWLIDLGFRSAAIKFSAEFRAVNDEAALHELVNTSLFYSLGAAALVMVLSLAVAPLAARAVNVEHPDFVNVIRIVGASWAFGLISNVFGGCLEGMQRFDQLSRIWILTTIVRSVSVVVVLLQGYGLLALAWVLFASQMLSYLATWWAFHRCWPESRFSWRGATRGMLRRLLGYGVHTLTAQLATRLLNYSIPLLLAYFLPVRFVAYYSVPIKILEYAMDGIGRIGMVTTPNAAEMAATGQRSRLLALGIATNRYCLSLYVPFAAVLLAYSREAYTLWLRRPEFVEQSAFLIPIMLIGYTAVSGQFNSVSILFGIGEQKTYVRLLLAEAVSTIAILAFTLPRFGLVAAGWTVAVMMTLNRCFVVAWLTAPTLGLHPLRYLQQIYTRPLLLGGVMLGLLVALKRAGLSGATWLEFLTASSAAGLLYVGLAYLLILEPAHRDQVRRQIRSRLGLAERVQPPAVSGS